MSKISSGTFFFRVVEGEEELVEVSKEAALRIFKKDSSSSPAGGDRYVVQIRNKIRYRLVLKYVSAGLSFSQTATTLQFVRDETGNAKVDGLSRVLVTDYVGTLFAANLQVISDVIDARKQWAFALAGDSSTCHGVSLFDMQIRFIVGVNLIKIHLLLVPFYERHTAGNTKH